uniref:Putative secreted protein n=1 Tax=Rhipicephalus microplus TaxID=6941 RepID=A0A6M2DAL9_RHIMP
MAARRAAKATAPLTPAKMLLSGRKCLSSGFLFLFLARCVCGCVKTTAIAVPVSKRSNLAYFNAMDVCCVVLRLKCATLRHHWHFL